METVPLRCASCGADLHPAPGADAAVCAYCGSRHALKRAGGASHDVAKIASDVTDIREVVTGRRLEDLERSARLAYLAAERMRLTHALARNPGCLALVFATIFFVVVLGMFRTSGEGVHAGAILVAFVVFVAVLWMVNAPKRRIRRMLTTIESEIRSLGG